MPGFYPEGEYDLAGFIVGVVEREKIVSGKDVQPGDIVLGLPSNGLHTNGYSLARKLLFEIAGYSPETFVSEIKNKVGNELMRTHRSYWPVIRKLIAGECVAALAHITGGGITENLPRVLPERDCGGDRTRNLAGVCRSSSTCRSWATSRRTRCCAPSTWASGCWSSFPPRSSRKPQTLLERAGEKFYSVGRIVKGERKVMYS